MYGQGPKSLTGKPKSLEDAIQDKRLMNWVFSVWKWENEENLKLCCRPETWPLSTHYKLVKWSVMSFTLCSCLVQWDCANLDHLLEPFQTFYLSEPELPQIKVPQDSPQDLVLSLALITTNCFWTYAVLWGIAWFSSEMLRWSWDKLWDMVVLSHSTNLRRDCWALETQPGHTVLE